MTFAAGLGIVVIPTHSTEKRCNYLTTVEEYDPASDQWMPAQKAPMPTARYSLAVGVVNDKIYAIGGCCGTGFSPLATVEEYDPATDKWTTKAPMPIDREGLAVGVVGGKIYAIGGVRISRGLPFF
jgi:N-acetylneuraminic acid mutarotase